jgi:hypothetical protein
LGEIENVRIFWIQPNQFAHDGCGVLQVAVVLVHPFFEVTNCDLKISVGRAPKVSAKSVTLQLLVLLSLLHQLLIKL